MLECKAWSHIVYYGLPEGAAKKTVSVMCPTAADFSGASVDVDANFVTLQSQLAKYVRSFNSQILLLRDELSRVKHTLDRAISRDISSIQDELNCVTHNYPRSSRRLLRNPYPYQSNRYMLHY